MARSTYQPHGYRKRRGGGGGGGGGRNSLFGDFGNSNDWYPGERSPFANFPPPPGMPRAGGAGGSGSGDLAEGILPQAQQPPQSLHPQADQGSRSGAAGASG